MSRYTTPEEHNGIISEQPQGLVFASNPRTTMELPIVGLHMHRRRRPMLRHEPQGTVDNVFRIDEEAYEAQVREVQLHNQQVWEESLTKLPVELYRHRRVAAKIGAFRSFETPEGNILAYDEYTGNEFWVNDLGQLATGLRRILNRKEIEKAVQYVKPDYQHTYDIQLNAFADDLPDPPNKIFHIQSNSIPMERYNEHMQLEYLYPSAAAILYHSDITKATLYAVSRSHRKMGNNYYRWYYDNGWTTEVKLMAQQVDADGIAVNCFVSVKEASEVLDIPTYTIYRLLRNPHSIDKYGCTWRRIGSTERAHTYTYDSDNNADF